MSHVMDTNYFIWGVNNNIYITGNVSSVTDMPSECIKDRNMVRFIQAEVKLVWVINISG